MLQTFRLVRCQAMMALRCTRLASSSAINVNVRDPAYLKKPLRKTKSKESRELSMSDDMNVQTVASTKPKRSPPTDASDGSDSSPPPKSLKQEILRIQSRYPNHILLVQVGGFYEIYEYAPYMEEIAHLLGLTIGGKDVRFIGFPIASLSKYVEKLLAADRTVAIVDQVHRDTMSLSKTFSRDVVRIVTPGTALNEDVEAKENTFLLSIHAGKEMCGLAWLDVCTGEFLVSRCHASELITKLGRIAPREVLVSEKLDPILADSLKAKSKTLGFYLTTIPASLFALPFSGSAVKKSAFGRSLDPNIPNEALRAVEATMAYVKETFVAQDLHMQPLEPLNEDDIVRTIRENAKRGSLLHNLDHTKTAAGGRLLSRRLKNPSTNFDEITRQLDIVEVFHTNSSFLQEIRHVLPKFRDVERYLQRMRLRATKPSDFVAVMEAFRAVSTVRDLIHDYVSAMPLVPPLPNFVQLTSSLHDFTDLMTRFDNLFASEKVPAKFSGPGLISRGLYSELDAVQDELEKLMRNSRKLVNSLSEKYGVPVEVQEDPKEGPCITLASGKNGIRADVARLIDEDDEVEPLRRQSLISRKKFRHSEWTKLFYEIKACEERHIALEESLFLKACEEVTARADEILETSAAIAHLDVASALAHVARDRKYVRPVITEERGTEIVEGRHPVVEMAQLGRDQAFIPNTLKLNDKDNIWLVTGPNMGGKSTFLRQCAIISVMAQAGCFVPASYARLGIVDRIFSRVGSSDDLGSNQSTFMVEMAETANILKNATPRSLVIMDEVGRGTSTHDGVSLALAIIKHLMHVNKARTIFATHYHELPELLGAFLDENARGVKFVKTLIHVEKGWIANASYGIEVAKLAGLPQEVIDMSFSIRQHLDEQSRQRNT
ncbi:muts domain V-domain-containing protein [Chytridium lagenaria]|nr:muts domain V-domain-containing protein [Chytridium lagenaria]